MNATTQQFDEQGRVLHFVGRITDEVFSFLGPATDVLARGGVAQTLVAIDDANCRRFLPRLHESIHLILVPPQTNPLRALRASFAAMRHALRSCDGRVHAIHLHGFVPSLVAPYAMRSDRVEAPIFYSPHSSKALGPMRAVGHVLWWVTRPVKRFADERGIANVGAEARSWTALSHKDAEVVEAPVPEGFLELARAERLKPLAVTGSRLDNPRSEEILCQLAVLLSGEGDGLDFVWAGSGEPHSRQRLKAAGVEVQDMLDDDARAEKLAAAWFYFAPGGTRGFPMCLVEAMSVGLPCIAMDTPYHRDLITDGETGFLCQTVEEVVRRVGQLMASPALRQSLGGAARQVAAQRFDAVQFRTSLFAAYDLEDRETQQ